jgi:putative transposase
MPRQSRLDAPGSLHHVIARGIERRPVFLGPADYDDFLRRLEAVTDWGKWTVCAWALLPNHLHLVVRTGPVPLASVMRRLMTGYAVAFNRRHARHGHLFQNRYKSILCDEEEYLLELVRYVGLNPLRAGLVTSLAELDRHPYSSHSALMGQVARPWQSVDEILGRFASRAGEARHRYRELVSAGIGQGHRPDLVGGGLVRSAGGWAEVLSLRRRKERTAADERVLGGGGFVEAVLQETDARERESLRFRRQRMSLAELEQKLATAAGLIPGEIRTASRRRVVVQARRAFAQVAVRRLGYAGAEVARYLGVTASCVNREAGKPTWERLAGCVFEPTPDSD